MITYDCIHLDVETEIIAEMGSNLDRPFRKVDRNLEFKCFWLKCKGLTTPFRCITDAPIALVIAIHDFAEKCYARGVESAARFTWKAYRPAPKTYSPYL